MNSIHFRLLAAATLVLAGFLLAGGVALEQGFRGAAEEAEREKLQSMIYGLLAAVKVDEQGGMAPPESLPEPRFSSPGSGLYAMVLTEEGKVFWRSPSTLGLESPDLYSLPPGKISFARRGRLFFQAQGIGWEDNGGKMRHYTFVVAEDAEVVERQVQVFRLSLWSWLGGMALVLLLAQGMILRWGLRPLRQVEKDLEAIREGLRSRLGGVYPSELRGLVYSLNSLMEHSRAVQERYRTSLDDLAHSLKTPMAYLKTVVYDENLSCERLRQIADEQLQRLDHIVQHQLRRAAVSARSVLVSPVAVAPLVQRLLTTLEKIHADRNIQVDNRVEGNAVFRGDEADFMELMGNLLENAFKYGNGRIGVKAWNREGLWLVIEDDGPGISPGDWPRLQRRGQRADESRAGQGIGLSVVREIVDLYGGRMEAGTSEIGGLRLELFFPDRPHPGS